MMFQTMGFIGFFGPFRGGFGFIFMFLALMLLLSILRHSYGWGHRGYGHRHYNPHRSQDDAYPSRETSTPGSQYDEPHYGNPSNPGDMGAKTVRTDAGTGADTIRVDNAVGNLPGHTGEPTLPLRSQEGHE